MTTNHHTHQSQAIEIAVDAHASRILRQHSPPEACVDFSSLGPYVTECLRKSIRSSLGGVGSGGAGVLLNGSNGGGIGNAVEALSNANAINDLIELLEGQCEMTRDTASMVIANIDRAVRTGDVLVAGDDNNNFSLRGSTIGSAGGGHSGMNTNTLDVISTGGDLRRTRSKSLGSEPLAYDVNFLGKILQDAMMMPSVAHSSGSTEVDLSAAFASAAIDMTATNELNSTLTTPSSESTTSVVEDVSPGIRKPPNSVDVVSSSAAAVVAAAGFPNKTRNKQRSVTFDETQSTTSFLWYDNMISSVSSPVVEPAVIGDDDDDVHFNPLGGILDVLDLEEEGGQQQQRRQQQTHMESILETSFATVDSNKSEGHNEKENERTMTASSSIVLDMQGGGSLLLPQCQMIFDPNEKVQASSPSSSSSPSSEFPTLGEAAGDTKFLSQKQNGASGKGRKSKKKKEANDLAAALFRPSRSRSNSLMDHPNQRPRALSLASSPMLRPSSADAGLFSAPSSGNGVGMGSLLSQALENAAVGNTSIATTTSTENNTASSSLLTKNNNTVQSEVISTTQLLLTLNSHLGTEAATLASQLTDGDLNLAQYLIEAARFDSSSDSRSNTANNSNRRSRICRHELRGTCYRSDCPYSHDLCGVTCLFWLRGRCRGESCRFMHGFAESLLDGISEDYLNEKREQDARKEREKEEEGKKIQTGNLLQHNLWAAASAGNNLSKSLPNHGFMFLSPQGGNDASMTTVWR